MTVFLFDAERVHERITNHTTLQMDDANKYRTIRAVYAKLYDAAMECDIPPIRKPCNFYPTVK